MTPTSPATRALRTKEEKGKRKNAGSSGPSLSPFTFSLLPSRRAHTLTELLVVLTILGLFAGIAMPRVIGSLMRSKLDTALGAIRSDVTFARARAVSSGLRHQVLMETETGELRVEPFRPEQQAAEGQAQTVEQRPALVDRISTSVHVTTWSVSPLGAAQGLATASQDGTGGGDGAPIVFYPEGRSDDAMIVLEDSEGARRGLRIDGFSGEIRELQPEELQLTFFAGASLTRRDTEKTERHG
jgi:prepilin-type N-terminal cleavage/methylation domain-containing protein